MSLLLTLEHVYATAISDLKKSGSFLESKILPALQKVEASAPTIEAISGLVSPQLANIERASEAVLGAVIKAIEDAGSAANSGGLSITLDASLIADIKTIIPAVKAAVSPANAAVVAAPKA
jgi:hypothetical protein